MEYDLHNNVTAKIALQTTAISSNTTTAGAIIDTSGYESIEFILISSTLTDGAYVCVLQDGDDSGLSDAANVDSSLLLGALPDFVLADDNAVRRVGCIAKKRYVRLSITSSAVTTGGTITAGALLGNPKSMPTAAQAT
jgi:hypothetical protein